MIDFMFDLWAFGWSALSWWHWVLIALIAPVLGMVIAALIHFKVVMPIVNKSAWFALPLIPIALVCCVYDIIFNLLYGSILFLELPYWGEVKEIEGGRLVREYDEAWTFSDRLQYHVTRGAGWRKRLAVWLGRIVNWLCELEHIRGIPQ